METNTTAERGPYPSNSLSKADLFSREKDVVGMYMESAKTYAQLSAGGLALGAAFAEKLLQQKTWLRPNGWLASASVFFMAALLFSAPINT